MSNAWQCLDNIYGLCGVPALWRSWLGGEFATFEGAFLERRAEPASSYPCPQECGCAHDLVERADGSFLAVCTCDPWNCGDFAVLRDEAALLELNWPRLERAICKAFECDYRETDLHLPLTRQIGSKFANAVPVVLTIQNGRDEFRQVVAGVVAQLGRPFILLGPTSRFLDANSLGLLHGARAEFFDLASHVTLCFCRAGYCKRERAAGIYFRGSCRHRMLNYLQLAEQVLLAKKSPLTAAEIWAEGLRMGFKTKSYGNTPADSLSSKLYMDIKNNPKTTLFERSGKLFSLRAQTKRKRRKR